MIKGKKKETIINKSNIFNDFISITIIAFFYILAHKISYFFPDSEKILMAIWPAGGIGLASLLLTSRRLWPVIIITLFVAGNTANLLEGRPLFASLGFMTANVLESFLCAWFVSGFSKKIIKFNNLKEIILLILSATIVNSFTSLIGAFTAVKIFGTKFWDFYLTWWVADGLGILIIAPIIISFSDLYKRFKNLR